MADLPPGKKQIMQNKSPLILVGAGPMAESYANCLKAQGLNFIVIGRGPQSAQNFKQATGHEVIEGGLEKYLANSNTDSKVAIVASSEDDLGRSSLLLLKKGFKKILVEKPGAFNAEEIQLVEKCSQENQAQIYVGYNRRFYASTLKAQQIIAEDGGIESFHFEFTEWSHKIEPLQKNLGVKENWFLHNSTHVVDLAFFLGGWPKEISCFTAGKLNWHPHARYAGAGRTDSNTLFSYNANWTSAGRWGVEILTPIRRLILRPMETLQQTLKGTVSVEPVKIDDDLDRKFKPGVFKQTENFIKTQPDSRLLTIKDQLKNLNLYSKMSP
jgi:predicted dehydrogenase